MGYRLNCLDEPVFMTVSKPLLTEFGIHHRLDSCAWFHKSFPCCLTGFHLHRHHTVRVLPWHGVECFHDGGLNLAMGWGPQRDLGSIGWDAGGLRLPCIPGSTPCLILRESRFVIQLITMDCRNKHILRVLCRNFSRISSDSVPNYCNHCKLQRPHSFVIFLFVYFLLSYQIVKKKNKFGLLHWALFWRLLPTNRQFFGPFLPRSSQIRLFIPQTQSWVAKRVLVCLHTN